MGTSIIGNDLIAILRVMYGLNKSEYMKKIPANNCMKVGILIMAVFFLRVYNVDVHNAAYCN